MAVTCNPARPEWWEPEYADYDACTGRRIPPSPSLQAVEGDLDANDRDAYAGRLAAMAEDAYLAGLACDHLYSRRN